MADSVAAAGVESPEDFDTKPARWIAELDAAERASRDWMTDAHRIQNRYLLRKSAAQEIQWDRATEFNILHSNVQTTLPAIFGKTPVPVVSRRHRDPDPVGRIASQILERALKTELDEDPFADSLHRVALDLLLKGRGTSWVRFEPRIEDEQLLDARSPVDFVKCADFLHAPKATWREVMKDGWVARRVSMTRQQGVARFGDVFKKVPLKANPEARENSGYSDDEHLMEVIGRAQVWEIWDQMSKTVIWLCKDYLDAVLDQKRDPLRLDGFFPCPMPAYGTLGNEDLIPTPDFLQYESLADELDDQTFRISVLTSALRAAGVYDGSMEGLGRLLEDSGEARNEMIPVSNWSQLQGQGIENVVAWLPLGPLVEALVGLYDARERTKQIIFEVSGLSDIMRGQVDPREKLGQSRLKGQFSSQRLQARVQVMENVARDTLKIKSEIIAEHYPPELIRMLSGYDFIPEIERLREAAFAQAQAQIQQAMQQAQQAGLQPPPMPDPAQIAQQAVDQAFQQALQLLRDERMRGFRLDIETNSTMLIDDDEEKQRRIEFIDSTGNFMERALPLAQAAPQFSPLLADMLMFSVRAFRGGRQLESRFEEVLETLRRAPMEEQQQQEGPDPAAEMEQAKMQAQMQVEQVKAQAKVGEIQAKQQLMNTQNQAKMREIAAKMENEQQKAQLEAMLTEMELSTKMQENEIEREKLAMEQEAQRQQSLVQIATARAMPQRPTNA